MRPVLLVPLLALTASACGSSGSPASPTTLAPLAVTSETEHYVFHVSAAATPVNAEWQEAYHRWAVARLAVLPSRKVGYFKYASRQDMGDHTGHYATNGYSDPAAFELHTLGSYDNHEIVHLLVSLIGDPTALFSEGVAVALQVDPVAGRFDSVFNGEEVHSSARRYLEAGQLVLPLERIVESSAFRAITDDVLSYREAGSFVRFLIDRYGIEALRAFLRAGGTYSDSAQAVKSRFVAAFGVSLEEAEAAWLAMLRS